MTKEQRAAVVTSAHEIKWRTDILDAIESAYRHTGDSVSGYISFSKRAASVIERIPESVAADIISDLRERMMQELAELPEPQTNKETV